MKFKNISKSLFVYFGLGGRFNSSLKLFFIRMFSFDYGFKLRLLYIIVLVHGRPNKRASMCFYPCISLCVHLWASDGSKIIIFKLYVPF